MDPDRQPPRRPKRRPAPPPAKPTDPSASGDLEFPDAPSSPPSAEIERTKLVFVGESPSPASRFRRWSARLATFAAGLLLGAIVGAWFSAAILFPPIGPTFNSRSLVVSRKIRGGFGSSKLFFPSPAIRADVEFAAWKEYTVLRSKLMDGEPGHRIAVVFVWDFEQFGAEIEGRVGGSVAKLQGEGVELPVRPPIQWFPAEGYSE